MHATAQRAGRGPPDPRMEYWRPTAPTPNVCTSSRAGSTATMLADRTTASAGLPPPRACKQRSWDLHLGPWARTSTRLASRSLCSVRWRRRLLDGSASGISIVRLPGDPRRALRPVRPPPPSLLSPQLLQHTCRSHPKCSHRFAHPILPGDVGRVESAPDSSQDQRAGQ